MCAMKSLTSGRRMSTAAEGSAIAHSTAEARTRRFNPDMARMWLRSNELAVRMQRHQDAEAGQQRDHRGAAIADHGQRHADHGQYAAHHSGIDKHIDEEAERDGPARQAGKCVLA